MRQNILYVEREIETDVEMEAIFQNITITSKYLKLFLKFLEYLSARAQRTPPKM